MRSRLSLVLAAPLVLLGSACFDVPATALLGLPLERKLLGRWDCRSAEESSADHALLTVLRFDAHQYYAEWKESDKVSRYRAYPGSLKGVPILNVTEISEDGTEYWTAVRTGFNADGTIALGLPAKRIVDVTGDDARLQTFRAEIDQPSAWQAFARCVEEK